MATFLLIIILCTIYSLSFSFHIRSLMLKPIRQKNTFSYRSRLLEYFMIQDDQQLIQINNIAVDGIISQANGFSNLQLAQTLHKKDGLSHIRLLVDDLAFAKKRLVSPDTVYSGLLDAMELVEVSRSDTALYQDALGKCESLIAFNVSLSELPNIAAAVADTPSMKRAVIALKETDRIGEQQHPALENAALLFKSKGVKYTLLRYNDVKEGPEARLPYRIVRGTQALPRNSSQQSGLLSGSLFRVLSEVVDLPKTYDAVYGIGPGTALDTEITTHMNSRGWSERVQVGVLMGDLMQAIEEKVQQEHARQKMQQQKAARIPQANRGSSNNIGSSKDQPRKRAVEKEHSKFAGFF